MPECAIGNVKLQVEIPILLIFFAFMLANSVTSNLIIYRTCYVTLGYNQSECALLGSKNANNRTAQLEKTVQPYATVISMAHLLTTAVVSTITCLFIGPWSDRFGRKPVLIIPIGGFLISYLWMLIFAVFDNVSPWFFMVCAIPELLSGGMFPYMAIVYCYVTDVTTEANRGLKMGLVGAAFTLGMLLGGTSSSYILAASNYATVFLISAFCCCLNLIYTVFFVPESLTVTETEGESEGRLKGLFQISNIVDMAKTLFKKRENYQRLTILSCILMLTLVIVQMNGDGAVSSYYLREKFHWSLERCTLYSSVQNVSGIFGTIIGIVILHKLLKFPETVMILIGSLSMVVSSIVMGFAINDWMLYVATVPRSLGSILNPMISSFFSKIVPPEEVGKIFSLIVATQSLLSMTGSPIYTAIYNLTLSTNPAIFNFVSAGIYLIEAFIVTLIIVLTTKDSYGQLSNEGTGEEIIHEEAVTQH